MTDELESGQPAVDSGEPTPQVAPKGDKQASHSASQPQENVGERLARIEKMVSSLQSGKDRAVSQTLGEVDELRKAFGEVQALMKRGLSEDDAFDQLESRKADQEFRGAVLELRDALKGGKSPSAQAGGASEAANVIAKAKLDPADPEVVRILREYGSDPVALALEAGKLSARARPAPDLSAAPPMQAGAPPAQPDTEKLRADYTKEMLAARGKPSELREIKSKYIKLGLQVDQIGFNV